MLHDDDYLSDHPGVKERIVPFAYPPWTLLRALCITFGPLAGDQRHLCIDDCGFIAITGPAKSGITYLGCAIGASCCALKHRTRYIRYLTMIQELAEANKEGSLLEKLNSFRNVPCLIIDGWLDSEISSQESNMMKEIFDYRAKTGGTVLISHTPVSQWPSKLNLERELQKSLMMTMTMGATKISNY